MDEGKKERRHVTSSQKKKLIELIIKHPELVSSKVTQDLNYKDFQKLWESIADECNSLPGPKKTWRRWRKTWQDIRSHTKKHLLATNGDIPTSIMVLTPAEQEVLGIKDLTTSNIFQAQHESTEFVPLESDSLSDCDLNNQMKSENLLSEPESSSDDVKTSKHSIAENKINCKCKRSRELSYNLERLAAQEQHKIQLKEDYLNFKKDYLKKKLKLMKEQTEAVKSIAKELLSTE